MPDKEDDGKNDIIVSNVKLKKATSYSLLSLLIGNIIPITVLYSTYSGIKKDDNTLVEFYLINDTLPEDSEVLLRTRDLIFNPLETGRILIDKKYLSILGYTLSKIQKIQ